MSSKHPSPRPPRILVADGPWGIRESILPSVYDAVTHKCKWRKNLLFKTNIVPAYIMKQENSFCTQCQEYVPSMIKTLWTLKNMDKIQNDANYGHKPWPSSFYTANLGKGNTI